MTRFAACLAETLKWEGGWSNHPKDTGGPTMRGVIQRVYDGWREKQGLARRSVKLIEQAELEAIYRENYWLLIRGDELPAGVDLAVFDFGVNSGPSRATKKLQACLKVTQDGHMGPATLAAACACDPATLIRQLMAERRAFLRQIKTFSTFGKGWLRRCDGIERAALTMIGAPSSAPIEAPLADADAQSASQGRATEEKQPASNAVVGTAAASAGAAVGQAVLPPPPPSVTETITTISVWQGIATMAKSFGDFAMANPWLVGGVTLVVLTVWIAPRVRS